MLAGDASQYPSRYAGIRPAHHADGGQDIESRVSSELAARHLCGCPRCPMRLSAQRPGTTRGTCTAPASASGSLCALSSPGRYMASKSRELALEFPEVTPLPATPAGQTASTTQIPSSQTKRRGLVHVLALDNGAARLSPTLFSSPVLFAIRVLLLTVLLFPS